MLKDLLISSIFFFEISVNYFVEENLAQLVFHLICLFISSRKQTSTAKLVVMETVAIIFSSVFGFREKDTSDIDNNHSFLLLS